MQLLLHNQTNSKIKRIWSWRTHLHLRESQWNRRNCYRGFIFVCTNERHVDATLDHFVVHKSRKSSRWASRESTAVHVYKRSAQSHIYVCICTYWGSLNLICQVESLALSTSCLNIGSRLLDINGQTFGTTLADSWWHNKADTSFEWASRRVGLSTSYSCNWR